MVRKSGLAFLAAIVTTTISIFHYPSVSSTGETGIMTRYEKFRKNYEESSDLKNSKNTPRCGVILMTIVDKIMELYTPEESLLCILTDSEVENDCFSNALEDFMELERRNVISLVSGARNFNSRYIIYQKPTVYFLLGVDLPTFLEPLSNFGKIGGTWNPRGLYISIAESEEAAAKLMKSLWQKFVYKVIVLVIQNKNFDTIAAYTWRPFYPIGYCGPPTVSNIVRLGKFTETLEFEKETDTRPGMIPETFGNCPLNISYNIWEPFVYSRAEDQGSALEVRLIEMICKRIRVNIIANYHPLIMFKDPSEAWAGTHIPISSDIKKYEISVPYIQDYFVWIVPRCNGVQLFEFGDEFPRLLWILSVLAMFLASVSLMVSGTKYWVLWVWGSLLEQADYKVAKKIRGIWACWLLLCLHLSVVYKTVLVSRLTDPSIKEDIQSQSDLVESELELGFLRGAEFWFDEEDDVEKAIVKRYVPCKTIKECYKEIPSGKAVFTNKMFADYLNGQKEEMGSIAEKVRQLPTSLTYKVVMIYAKGHAMLPSFDKFLHLTMQAGFIEHWTEEIKEIQTRIDTKRFNPREEHRLSFAQVNGGFQFLRTGLIVAGVSFFCEIINPLLQAIFVEYMKESTGFWN